MSDSTLLAAYLATAWTVDAPAGPLTVRFNHVAPDPLLRPSGIVTAHHPASGPLSDVEARRAHDLLLLELRHRGLPFRPAYAHPVAVSAAGHGEPGFAVLGEVRDLLVELGGAFGQHAVVWIDARGRVSLVCAHDGFAGCAAGEAIEAPEAAS
ncbi:MAG TPA: DUF3293 domain-containing protein [Longimicrobiaceae bacterium]|nr:DUF3293 domain-containing protein [Longimicrobiaceae bacterium]